MNNSPFLSVVVGMVPVCCSDLLPWGNHPPFTTRVSRLGAVTPPAGRSAGVTGRHGCVTAHEPLTGCPPPVPRRSARTGRLDRAGNTKGRMMTFVKRVRSAAVVVLLAHQSGRQLGLPADQPGLRHSRPGPAHRPEPAELLGHLHRPGPADLGGR